MEMPYLDQMQLMNIQIGLSMNRWEVLATVQVWQQIVYIGSYIWNVI